MGTWARAELEGAFQHYQDTVRRAGETANWNLASNFTLLRYAGENRFSYEEDTYNPAHFLTMVKRWSRAADANGTLPDDGRSWLHAIVPGWNAPAA